MAEKTVIVAYDGSAAAKQAVRHAAELLSACRLLIVTVWEPALAYETPAMTQEGTEMVPMISPDVADEVEQGMHQQAEDLAREGADIATSLGCRAEPLAAPDYGNVARTLLKLADECGARAIVVGSRGLGGIRARLEGSTSRSLVKHARCPVLLVHESDERHPEP